MSTHAKTLYPTPPPTTNTLDKEQRTRLLRSTRKLGAVLGTTPFLLEPLPPVPPIPSSDSTYTLSCKTPITPRTRAYRREGRIFPSDSESSDDDDDSFDNRDSYVFVPTHLPSAPYQLQSLPPLSPLSSPSGSSSPSSSRASSLDVQRKPLPIPQPRKDKGKGKATLRPLPPIHIALPSLPVDLPGSQISVKRGKPLPQPLLLRLRSVPVAPNDTRATGKRDSVLSSPTTTVQAQPLSPLSPTFSVNTTTPERKRAPTDKEKRRKMAKLVRTLGENVPPELVFGTSPGLPSHPSGPRAREHRRMRSETVTARQHAGGGGGKTLPGVPPLPALPTPPFTTSSSSSASSATRGINRPNRPRSLTLSSIPPPRSSSLPTTEEIKVEGAGSGGLKIEVQQSTLTSASGTGRTPTRPRAPSHAYSRSLGIPATTTSARNHTHAHAHTRGATMASAPAETMPSGASYLRGESIEFGRRKEREWSGEWNVRDMGDVQRRLRGLKL